jgi:hypothetical protein
LAAIGTGYLEFKEYTRAEVILRECWTIRQAKQPDNWVTFNTQSMIGGSLLGQKKYAEAEPLLLQGYEGMKKREATIAQNVKFRLDDAAERLVLLYEALGQKDKAAEWRMKLPPEVLPMPKVK